LTNQVTPEDTPEDIPEVWHSLATMGAKHYRGMLQASINAAAQVLDVNAPTISPNLMVILTDPTLWRGDPHDEDQH